MTSEIKSNKLLKFFQPKYRVYQHLLFWIVYFIDSSGIFYYDRLNFPLTLSVFFIDMAMMYFNLYFLLPRLLLKNKFFSYLGLTFVTLVADIALSELVEFAFFCKGMCMETHTLSGFIIKNLVSFQLTTFFLGTAVGLKMFKIWIYNQERIRQLENINLNTELNYLKSQINPHFLFNTLNNIYVLSRIDKENASQTILKLSDLLRYQLYDCSKDNVLLVTEIEYLKNYLELERIRKTQADVEFELKGNPQGKMIPPFIFIPFIENAVKHGLNSGATENFVKISMNIENTSIHFQIENSFNPNAEKSPGGGLGLNNIKRRLELLFPGKYNLEIHEKGDHFFVDLKLHNIFN